MWLLTVIIFASIAFFLFINSDKELEKQDNKIFNEKLEKQENKDIVKAEIEEVKPAKIDPNEFEEVKRVKALLAGKEEITSTAKVEMAQDAKITDMKLRKSKIISEHEKMMFFDLKKAVPEYFIFVQVSLGEILWSPRFAARGHFNQKRADFVITDNDFNILAVIELDDPSHIGKEEQDAFRDGMLKSAGYKVLRYKRIPDIETLRKDILN